MEIIENWSRLNQNEPEIKVDMYVHVCNIHHISCHGNDLILDLPKSCLKYLAQGLNNQFKSLKTAVAYIRDEGSNSFTDNTLNSSYQLTKQNGLVCSLGPTLLICIVWLEYLISRLRSYWDFRETVRPRIFPYFKNINLDTSNIFCSHSQWNTFTPSLM